MPGFPPNTVAVFDLDGTLTRRDSYLGILIHSLGRNPAAIPKLSCLVLPVIRFKLGQIDNTKLKTDFLRVLLAGLPERKLNHVTRSFLHRLFATGLREEALTTLNRHRAAGHKTVLLSAALDFYVDEIARCLNFDHCICTETVRRPDNTLSGELKTRNCHGEEKLARLKSHFGQSFEHCYFVGYADHETDLPLLKQLDAGVVVNAGRSTRAMARQAGLQVVEWR